MPTRAVVGGVAVEERPPLLLAAAVDDELRRALELAGDVVVEDVRVRIVAGREDRRKPEQDGSNGKDSTNGNPEWGVEGQRDGEGPAKWGRSAIVTAERADGAARSDGRQSRHPVGAHAIMGARSIQGG